MCVIDPTAIETKMPPSFCWRRVNDNFLLIHLKNDKKYRVGGNFFEKSHTCKKHYHRKLSNAANCSFTKYF